MTIKAEERTPLEVASAAMVRAARVLQRNGFGHYDSQRAAHALADAGLLHDAELAAVRVDLVAALEALHQCAESKNRLIVDNIRMHRQRIDTGT